MGAQYPLDKLDEVIELCAAGVLPAGAGEWATSAYGTTEAILETIDCMRSDGKDAPTPGQTRALRNIHDAACRWIDSQSGSIATETPSPLKVGQAVGHTRHGRGQVLDIGDGKARVRFRNYISKSGLEVSIDSLKPF